MVREELIEKYLENKLSESERQAFERHVAADPELAHSVTAYRRLIAAAREAERAALFEKISHIPPRPTLRERAFKAAPYVAGIAVFLAVGYGFYKRLPRIFSPKAPLEKSEDVVTSNPPQTVYVAQTPSTPQKKAPLFYETVVETVREDGGPAPSTVRFMLMRDSSLQNFRYQFQKDTLRSAVIDASPRLFLFSDSEEYYIYIKKTFYRFKPYIPEGTFEAETDSLRLRRLEAAAK